MQCTTKFTILLQIHCNNYAIKTLGLCLFYTLIYFNFKTRPEAHRCRFNEIKQIFNNSTENDTAEKCSHVLQMKTSINTTLGLDFSSVCILNRSLPNQEGVYINLKIKNEDSNCGCSCMFIGSH